MSLLLEPLAEQAPKRSFWMNVEKLLNVQMMSFFARPFRSVGLLAFLLTALFFAAPQNASGQIWLQTARVITPVQDGPTRVFLDSLVNVMERKDVKVKRSPDADETMRISDLRDELIDEVGIALKSANHAFIDYRFLIDNGGDFRQEIARIHFVFRPGPQQTDTSVLYVDAQKPWVEKLIHQKGTSLRTNEAALIPFQRHLNFADIAKQKESKVVEISGETVREKFDERKRALIRKVEELMYESFV